MLYVYSISLVKCLLHTVNLCLIYTVSVESRVSRVEKCWIGASKPETVSQNAAVLSPKLQGSMQSLALLIKGAVNATIVDGTEQEIGTRIVSSMWDWDTLCLDVPVNASHIVFTALSQDVSIDGIVEHEDPCDGITKGNSDFYHVYYILMEQ